MISGNNCGAVGSHRIEGEFASMTKFMSGVARLAFAGLLLAGVSAQAHHSFAMFDHDHQIKISGTVTHFQWTNPHVYIDLDVHQRPG